MWWQWWSSSSSASASVAPDHPDPRERTNHEEHQPLLWQQPQPSGINSMSQQLPVTPVVPTMTNQIPYGSTTGSHVSAILPPVIYDTEPPPLDHIEGVILPEPKTDATTITNTTGTQQSITPTPPLMTTTTATTATLPFFHIVALLSTAFAYGCIFTTLFVITLPIECERIQQQQQRQQEQMDESMTTNIHRLVWSKSTWLGIFVAMAGLTQLISPIIGYMSDNYIPPRLRSSDPATYRTSTTTASAATTRSSPISSFSPLSSSSLSLLSSTSSQYYAEVGRRLPYYIIGAMLATTGLMGQMLTSYSAYWIHYSLAFIFSMIGLNIQYAMMLALIPDQISSEQIGIANGILAFLLVLGSIFGFTLFHVLLYQDSIQSMYGLYASIVILTSILTSSYAHERDAEISAHQLIMLQHRCSQQSILDQKNKLNSIQSITNHSKLDADCTKNDPMEQNNRPSSLLWHVQARVTTKQVVRGAVQKAQQMVVTPTLILRSMIAPVHRLNYYTLIQCYTIDRNTNYNFLIVTLSRLFYYCGMSIQTFFLYYIHDIIQIPPHENPETIVAILAMIGQCSGAMTCYPVGMISDRLLHGRRKPFIYIACIILAAATFSFIYARTVHHVIILSTILGAANGMYLTAETSLAVDTLTTEATNHTNQSCHETSTNENNENNIDVNHGVAGTAQLLGIWGVAAFVGSALGPLIGGPLLEAFGTTTTAVVNNATSHQGSSLMHHPSDVTVTELTATSMTAYTITGYTVILSLSSFYFVCSAVILQYIKVNKKESTDSEVSETTI